MANKLKSSLEVFSKSIVQPLMYLSVAGTVLILGILLTNQTITSMVPFLQLPFFATMGKIIYNSLMFIVNNLAVIFCAGIAGAMAKKDKGHATLIGLMSFFLFLNANNITLEALGMLAEPTQLGLVGTGQSEVLGIQVLDMGVFGGIILGCIAGWVFNKFGGKQFPIALSMFSGVRFPFLIMICISLLLGVAACYAWPPVQGSIASLAGMIQESGNIGLFLYGMLNKLLVPLGLHHLIYTPFQFSDVGGTLALGDTVIAGAYPIRVAEMAMVGQPFSASTYFNSYTFNNLWPYLGIGTAFIVTSYKRNRDKTRAIGREGEEDDVEPSTALETAAPADEAAASADKVTAAPAAGDPVLDLIAGLGGKANIQSTENCFTRLRVNVADESLIDEDLINHMKNSGIVRSGNDIQIIFGMEVAKVRGQVEEALENM